MYLQYTYKCVKARVHGLGSTNNSPIMIHHHTLRHTVLLMNILWRKNLGSFSGCQKPCARTHSCNNSWNNPRRLHMTSPRWLHKTTRGRWRSTRWPNPLPNFSKQQYLCCDVYGRFVRGKIVWCDSPPFKKLLLLWGIESVLKTVFKKETEKFNNFMFHCLWP